MVAVTIGAALVRKRKIPEQLEAVILSSIEEDEFDGEGVMVLLTESPGDGTGLMVKSTSPGPEMMGESVGGWVSVVLSEVLGIEEVLSVVLVVMVLLVVEEATREVDEELVYNADWPVKEVLDGDDSCATRGSFLASIDVRCQC